LHYCQVRHGHNDLIESRVVWHGVDGVRRALKFTDLDRNIRQASDARSIKEKPLTGNRRLSLHQIIPHHRQTASTFDKNPALARTGTIQRENAGRCRASCCSKWLGRTVVGLDNELEFAARHGIRAQDIDLRGGYGQDWNPDAVGPHFSPRQLRGIAGRIRERSSVSQPPAQYGGDPTRAAGFLPRTAGGVHNGGRHGPAGVHLYRHNGTGLPSGGIDGIETDVVGAELGAVRRPLKLFGCEIEMCASRQCAGGDGRSRISR